MSDTQGGTGPDMRELARLVAAQVAGNLGQPAAEVRRLLERARGDERAATLEALLPAIERLLAAIECFTAGMEGDGDAGALATAAVPVVGCPKRRCRVKARRA